MNRQRSNTRSWGYESGHRVTCWCMYSKVTSQQLWWQVQPWIHMEHRTDLEISVPAELWNPISTFQICQTQMGPNYFETVSHWKSSHPEECTNHNRTGTLKSLEYNSTLKQFPRQPKVKAAFEQFRHTNLSLLATFQLKRDKHTFKLWNGKSFLKSPSVASSHSNISQLDNNTVCKVSRTTIRHRVKRKGLTQYAFTLHSVQVS